MSFVVVIFNFQDYCFRRLQARGMKILLNEAYEPPIIRENRREIVNENLRDVELAVRDNGM